MTVLVKLPMLFLLQYLITTHTFAVSLYQGDVQWSVAEHVYAYTSYKDVSLLSVYIPPNTEQLLLILQGTAIPTSCPLKTITVYIQHGGYPVISPYNETFPNDFHLKRTSLYEFSTPSSNDTVHEVIHNPEPGTWYAAGLLRKYGTTHLSQKGFSKNCNYVLTVIAVNKVLVDVWDIAVQGSQTIHLGIDTERLFRFQIPDNVVAYDMILDKCVANLGNKTKIFTVCPLYLTLSEGSLPSKASYHHNCSETNNTCHFQIVSPPIGKWSFLKLVRNIHIENLQGFSFNIKFTSYGCEQPELLTEILSNTTVNKTNYASQINKFDKASCISASPLGKYSLESLDFTAVFLFHNFALLPSPLNEIIVSDDITMTTSFRIVPLEDSGGTIRINLKFLDIKMGTGVSMCVLKDRIPYKAFFKNCTNGILLKVNSTSALASSADANIPYPEAGIWYIALKSWCFNPNKTGNIIKCVKFPAVTFSVVMQPCFKKCGRFGRCAEFISGTHIYSSCLCYAGWRGYGCTDGTYANSMTSELWFTLLLTLSNMFFLPGILLSLHRHYFVEAFVFTFNMFFSTFYHACDSSKIYQLCIMKYDTLGFGDFLGSFMSFWMIFLAMSKIPDRVRSILHMCGGLMIAVFMNYDRHGSWETIVPLTVAGAITIISWIYRMYKYRKLFPSKMRWIKFLIPGFILAISGIIIFSSIETDENYKYTHSAWHIIMTLSILFLLPPRKNEKTDPPIVKMKRKKKKIFQSENSIIQEAGYSSVCCMPAFKAVSRQNQIDPS